MRCAVYGRTSTELFSQKGSLENQQTFFENYIKEKKWTSFHVYTDDGITGTSTVKRPDFRQLMSDAEQHKFDVVLVKSRSRWSRDTVDSLTFVRLLKSFGINLISVSDGYNSFEDHGELMLTMLSAVAQHESEASSVRVSWGIAEKSRKGVFHGTPPYGYDKVNGKLVPNVINAPIVQKIFHLYLHEGWGWQKIANHLTDHKVPTPRSISRAKNAGTVWHETAVKIILNNLHYTGDLVQGRSKVDLDDKMFNQKKGYKKRLIIDEGQWIMVPDTHPSIISREEFAAVQDKVAFKARSMFSGRGKKSLFARLAYCADCGKGMNYKNDREGYVCSTYQKRGSKACASHFFRHDELKETVLEDLRQLSVNSLDRDSLVEAALKKANVKSIQAQSELQLIQKKLQHLQQEQLELVRTLIRKIIDDETFQMSNVALKDEQSTLKARETILEADLSQGQENERFLYQFREEIKRFAELHISNEEVLREVLRRLIERIEIGSDGDISIHYNFIDPLSSRA